MVRSAALLILALVLVTACGQECQYGSPYYNPNCAYMYNNGYNNSYNNGYPQQLPYGRVPQYPQQPYGPTYAGGYPPVVQPYPTNPYQYPCVPGNPYCYRETAE